MKNNFPHVFSPLTVRGMTLKNRVVMMPMGSDFAGHDGELSDEHIKYYELRARGGTGLIMVENVCVKYPEGSNGTTQLRLDKDCYIPRLFTLTEACHRQGALMGIQINHAGASAMSSRIGMQPVSASRFPSKAGGEIPRGRLWNSCKESCQCRIRCCRDPRRTLLPDQPVLISYHQ